VLKHAYFMVVIDVVVCLNIYKRQMLSVVTFEWSEIMGTCNTPDTIVKDMD